VRVRLRVRLRDRVRVAAAASAAARGAASRGAREELGCEIDLPRSICFLATTVAPLTSSHALPAVSSARLVRVRVRATARARARVRVRATARARISGPERAPDRGCVVHLHRRA
jgi:hypothetical protein